MKEREDRSWKQKQKGIQETGARAWKVLQQSVCICPLSVVLIFTSWDRALSASGKRKRETDGGSGGGGSRKCAAAFRKRTRNVCKYDGGRITYVKAWKSWGTYFHKILSPFVLPPELRYLPDQSRCAWNIQKQNDYTLKGADAAGSIGTGYETKITRRLGRRDARQKHEYKMVKEPRRLREYFLE